MLYHFHLFNYFHQTKLDTYQKVLLEQHKEIKKCKKLISNNHNNNNKQVI